MTELLLLINLLALIAVYIHHITTSDSKKSYEKPLLSFAFKKERELSEEEKRDAEILEDIANYNGMEVRK